MTDSPAQRDPLHASERRFRLMVESVRDYAIFMLDARGHVQTWNPGAERFKGYRADEIIGAHFSRFYPPEALARGLPAHELEVAARVGSFEDEGWRVRKDGSRFWANVVITAVRDPNNGELIGFAKVTRDLSQRRAHEETLRRSEERFRLLVEGVRDYAIFMLDPNGIVASWNVGAQRIKGWAAGEIIGRHFSLFYPAEAVASGWPEHELTVAAQQGSFVDEGWRVRKDGSRFWANVTITALRDEPGRLLGFAKLTRDLSDRRRAEAAEREGAAREQLLDAERSARMQAQGAMRAKDEFLATLSHELRTPLGAILGWTQLLLRGPAVADAGLRHAIEVIDRNARAQSRLIDDLLDLSRIRSGKLRLDLRPARLDDIVREAVESSRPAAAAKGIRLEAALGDAPALVSGDAARLQQVAWNLLGNAIKFTPRDGRVDVALRCAGAKVELVVADTGIGIPAHFLPHVFERFSQRDGSLARAHGGLGLGLAISKQLVELHGGALRAASAGEGLGATFVVELPLALAPPAEAPAAPAERLRLPSLKGIRVFVVDDEPDARELARRMLEDHEAVVSVFDSGETALAELRLTRPDVIVSDIGMPRMDGHQFMRAFRASEAPDERVPALALTAFALAEDRERSLLAGYQAHLAKPFDVAELLLLVAGMARKSTGGPS